MRRKDKSKIFDRLRKLFYLITEIINILVFYYIYKNYFLKYNSNNKKKCTKENKNLKKNRGSYEWVKIIEKLNT